MRRLLFPDLLRSSALLLMVAYHVAFDLHAYYGYAIDLSSPAWFVLGRIAALSFLFLAGLSTALSLEGAAHPWRKSLRRAGLILAAALGVTAVTFLIDPGTYVRFGVLHLIGISVLFLGLLRRYPWIALLLALAVPLAPRLLAPSLPAWAGIPLGLPPEGFASVDYYPLLPWAGVVFLGFGSAPWLLPALRRGPAVAESPRWLRALAFPGRHTLAVYLLHQPVIAGILWLLLGRPGL